MAPGQLQVCASIDCSAQSHSGVEDSAGLLQVTQCPHLTGQTLRATLATAEAHV